MAQNPNPAVKTNVSAVDPSLPVLSINNLTKHYKGRPKPAISNISFSLARGEFHAFVGANGAGKTTTIKSIVGAYSKNNYTGSISVMGHFNYTREAKDQLGYIPEIARFPMQMPLYDYLFCMARIARKTSKESKEIANRLIKELNMENFKKVSPNTMSSGQKKKVLLAQALINDPKVIVMDEPAANLDPVARIDFFKTLKTLQERGVSILISSHILSELSKYADSVTIIDGGEVKVSGKVADIQRESKKHYLISTNNDEQINNWLSATGGANITVTEDKVLEVFFRDEQQLLDLKRFIATNRIEVNLFKPSEEDLEALYKKYVITGSVDTARSK